MHTQNPIINQSRNRQAIEAINESFPQFNIISSFTCINKRLTLIIKPINSIDRGALVVSSEKEKVSGVFYFVGQ
jgi:hypothetical protein